MKILINTTNEMIQIGDTLLIPGEWVHVESDFTIPDEYYDDQEVLNRETMEMETVRVCRIKTAPVILDEKLALIPDAAPVEEVMQIVEEQNINGWVNGILEAGYDS